MKDYPKIRNKKSKSLIRKKNVVTKRSSLKLAFTWIAVILVALVFVQQRISFIRTEKRVNALVKAKENIETSILPLKLEERYLTRYEIIEETAKSKLKLQVPRKVQIIPLTVGHTNEDQKKSQDSLF